jgi:hypothetical protein
MLNHTETLRLDQKHVQSDLILNWYGIAPPELDLAFGAAGRAFVLVEDSVYMDDQLLDEHVTGLHGAIEIGDLLVVAEDNAILLLTEQGMLVERIENAEGVPAGLAAIGRTANGVLVVNAAHGLYTADRDFLKWKRYTGADSITWSKPKPPPLGLAGRLRQHYRAHTLPVERVVLDLHSGRILGSIGVFLVDAAAVLLFLLGLSGCWLWIERFRKRRAHHKGG